MNGLYALSNGPASGRSVLVSDALSSRSVAWAVTAPQPLRFFLPGRVGPRRVLAPFSVTTQTGLRADPPHASKLSAAGTLRHLSFQIPTPAALEDMATGDDVAFAPAVCQHGVV